MKYFLDASVATKWELSESNSDKANLLRAACFEFVSMKQWLEKVQHWRSPLRAEFGVDRKQAAFAMKTYETSATVEDQGQIRLAGVPFARGTEVEVTINPKRGPAEQFTIAWRRICAELRARPDLKDITDETIREEIGRYRSAP